MEDKDNSVKVAANAVAESLKADVIHYNGTIDRHQDRFLIEQCIHRRRRDNVLLMLVTDGGEADVAFRMARCLQVKYSKFYLYVSGYCKSAGTLVAAGAHELIISDHGELGPLDVQMYKKDELWEMQSGLTIRDTLTSLHAKAFDAFEEFFMNLKMGGGSQITLKMATEIATQLTTGLFSPLYGNVDPLHIGESGRAMSIASHYGTRLLEQGQNIEPAELEKITSDYPSHGFVIDREEAAELFVRVRGPEKNEIHLADLLGERARWPDRVLRKELLTRPLFQFLSDELQADDMPTVEMGKDDAEFGGGDDGETAKGTGSSTLAVAEEEPQEHAEYACKESGNSSTDGSGNFSK